MAIYGYIGIYGYISWGPWGSYMAIWLYPMGVAIMAAEILKFRIVGSRNLEISVLGSRNHEIPIFGSRNPEI